MKRQRQSSAMSSNGRKSKHIYTTKSGQTIRLNRSLASRWQSFKDDRARRRAQRLAGLPKGRIKRFFYHFHPKRMYRYWFSREGVIMALKIAGIGLVAGFALLIGVFAYFRKDLPNLRDIAGSNIGGSIRYYDKSGQTLLWEDYDAVKRIPVKDNQISKYVKDATIAIEDKDFFHHGGFDVRGIVRAGINDVFRHNGTQGGSTITQQLVKLNNDWTNDQTYRRKIKELILAVELERTYTKQEILNGYLNIAPYGSVDYGVEAAARDYFHKAAKDLTIDEAVMLAAIPKAPSVYSPYSPNFDKKAFNGRWQYILGLMLEQGMISKKQHDKAVKTNVIAKVHPRLNKYTGIKAPWFVLAAKGQLENKYGSQTATRAGWKVTTTIDLKLQKIAEDQLAQGMIQVRNQGGDVAAFVAEDVHTGKVVALVGGPDFYNPTYGQNNYAADYRLPPGSSFKPYDYTSLIENTTNFGAGSVLYDSRGPLPGYPCNGRGNCLEDYDFRFPGPLTLRYALGGSRNVPAVKAMLIAGIDKTIQTADKLMGNDKGYQCYSDDGLTVPAQCYSSAAIGDGAYLRLKDHVNGYTTIARNGNRLPQTFIAKIEDSAGKIVDQWRPTPGDQVVRPEAAYIVGNMISDPNASYFPTFMKPHRYNNQYGTWKFAMKTGTTNDGKDGWMMGFSSQYAAGVWVGYHNRQRVMSGTMETMTLPIWRGWMNQAHSDIKPVDIEEPRGIQRLPAFVVRNHVGIGSIEPSPSTDLYPSWYRKPGSNKPTKQIIDTVSNKLATDCTPPLARKEVISNASGFSGDIFVNPSRATNGLTEKDDIHKCDDVKPSLDNLTLNPANGNISVIVHQGTHPLNSDRFRGTVNFIANGQTVRSFTVTSDGQSVTLPGGAVKDGTRVSAQVIDSVLYQGDSPNSVVESGGGSPSSNSFAITNPSGGSANTGSASYLVIWSGGSGPYEVENNDSSIVGCDPTSSNSCTVTLDMGANVVSVTDDNGETRTVTINRH